MSSPSSHSASLTASNKKADQIVHRFYVKAVLLLAQARESDILPDNATNTSGAAPAGSRGRGDRWFNLETPETLPPHLPLIMYRTLSAAMTPPPPLTILTVLLIPPLTPSQLLVLNPPPVSSSVHSTSSTKDPSPQILNPPPRAIVLERWTIELIPLTASQQSLPSPSPPHPYSARPQQIPSSPPVVPGSEDEPLQRVYKRGISLFRALFQLLRQLPAWQVLRRLRSVSHPLSGERGGRGGRDEGMSGLKMVLRLPGEEKGAIDFDSLASIVSPSPRTTSHHLSAVPTPHGSLTIRADVLTSPHFALANKESLLSSRFVAQDRRRAASRRREGAYQLDEDDEEEGFDAAEEDDDGLGDPLPPSLNRFSTSPDAPARLAALAQGSLGNSPGSRSLRAAAALNQSQYNAAIRSAQASLTQLSLQPQPPPPPALSESPTSSVRPTAITGSRGSYFTNLPVQADLPFAVPQSANGSGRSSPSQSTSMRDRERERERKTSLLSTMSMSSLDSPFASSSASIAPPASQIRRPSLNSVHPFKPNEPPITNPLARPGTSTSSAVGGSGSHPPSPLHAQASKQLPFPSDGSPSASAVGGSASGTGDEAQRPPLRTTRYSSSFSHRHSSGSGGSGTSVSAAITALGTSPVSYRPPGTSAGSPSLLARSLSNSLSQSQLATSAGGRVVGTMPESIPEGEVIHPGMGASVGSVGSSEGRGAPSLRRYSSSFPRRPTLAGSGRGSPTSGSVEALSAVATAIPGPGLTDGPVAASASDPDLNAFLAFLDSGPGISGSPRPSSLTAGGLGSTRAARLESSPTSISGRDTVDTRLRAIEERFRVSLGELGSSDNNADPLPDFDGEEDRSREPDADRDSDGSLGVLGRFERDDATESNARVGSTGGPGVGGRSAGTFPRSRTTASSSRSGERSRRRMATD